MKFFISKSERIIYEVEFVKLKPLPKQPFYTDLRFAAQSSDVFEPSHHPKDPSLQI